jgi:Tol biopolymer transport system component
VSQFLCQTLIAAVALCLIAETGAAAGSFPGGDGLIIAAGGAEEARHVWTVDPRSGARVQLTSGSDRDADPAFSPDGRRIVFERCPVADRCRIATVAVTGANETDLTRAPAAGHDGSPSFSPDGSRIVFTRTERSGRHLFVTGSHGHDARRLTSGRVQDRGAVYSPDGASIVFERYRRGVGFRIFEIAVRGGAPRPLTSGPGDYGPGISPGGSRIAFARRSGSSSAIWLMDANGERERALTTPDAGISDARPAFSADGTQIVFDRLDTARPNGEQLIVVDAAGRGQRAITPPWQSFHSADWQSLHPPGGVVSRATISSNARSANAISSSGVSSCTGCGTNTRR